MDNYANIIDRALQNIEADEVAERGFWNPEPWVTQALAEADEVAALYGLPQAPTR